MESLGRNSINISNADLDSIDKIMGSNASADDSV